MHDAGAVTAKPWSPEFELDYVRQTSRDELIARHADHWLLFNGKEIEGLLASHAVVAEVGCGAAGGLLNFVPRPLRAVAIDPLIEQYDRSWLPHGAVLISAFAHAIPLACESVHLLICIEALDHCDNMDQFRQSQAELARVLAPGGRLLFMLPARDQPRDGHPCHPCTIDVVQEFKRLGLEVERDKFDREGTWLILKKPQHSD